MQARPNFWLVVLFFFASLFPIAHSYSQNEIKQTSRRDVVQRERRRLEAPLRPRTSSMPCVLPTAEPPQSPGGYEILASGTGVVMDLTGIDYATTQMPNTDTGTAVNDCANYANNLDDATFEIYFDQPDCVWVCITIYEYIDRTSLTVPDTDVTIAAAYSYIV